GLLDRPQVDAVGKLAHELIQEMHRLATIRLKRLDDLLARQHRLDLPAQPIDFLDLLVELGDLRLEERVTALLVVDPRSENAVTDADRGHTAQHAQDRERNELPLARLALLRAVRQQVDADDGHY